MGVVRVRQVVTMNVSLSGWGGGGIHEGRRVNGRWGQHLTNLHINYLEMLAVFLTLKHFLPFLKGHHVLVRTDNCCGLHKLTGRSQITSFAHVSTQTNFMEQCQSFIPESDARTGCYVQGCGSAVQGQSPLRGVEVEQGSGRTDLGHIRQSDSGSVHVPR